jgi:hypothetical protein
MGIEVIVEDETHGSASFAALASKEKCAGLVPAVSSARQFRDTPLPNLSRHSEPMPRGDECRDS